MNADNVRDCFNDSQSSVIERLLSFDPKVSPSIDSWTRTEGGGGKSCAYANGNFLEKGGINFSDVQGASLPPTALSNRSDLSGSPFRAMGVSIVFHPINPHVPTAHANIRFFSTKNKEGEDVWWFGGGFDLTPYYPILSDVIYWHQQAKDCCDKYDQKFYNKFKTQCDEYFYLPHREETRGVGGIFFDDLVIGDFSTTLNFCKDVLKVFADSYFSISEKRKGLPFTKSQKQFQNYRRGRYVEFNLVYDRGTHFGLQSNGRTESILMSMPPRADWAYDWKPHKGSKEDDLYQNYLKPIDWLNLP